MEKKNFEPKDAGCWFDGLRGIHIPQMVLDLAKRHGMWAPDVLTPEEEWTIEYLNKAEEYLNEYAPEGFSFGFNPDTGDWGLWKDEEEPETPFSTVMSVSSQFDNALTMNGFDDALVGFGLVYRDGKLNNVAIYSYDKMVECLSKEWEANGHPDEGGEVEEYLQFNVLGAYVGPNTPVVAMQSWLGDNPVIDE